MTTINLSPSLSPRQKWLRHLEWFILLTVDVAQVDLTKFTEEHNFFFDEVCDSLVEFTIVWLYPRFSVTTPQTRKSIRDAGLPLCDMCSRSKGKLLVLRMDRPALERHTRWWEIQSSLDCTSLQQMKFSPSKRRKAIQTSRYVNLRSHFVPDDIVKVWVSFFEIYGGKLYDLLNDRRKLVARADAKQVCDEFLDCTQSPKSRWLTSWVCKRPKWRVSPTWWMLWMLDTRLDRRQPLGLILIPPARMQYCR